MAACDLAYIKKLPSVIPDTEKNRLNDNHYDIAHEIKALGTVDDPLFYQRSGYLRLNPAIPATYQDQLRELDELNLRRGGTANRPVVFRTTVKEYDKSLKAEKDIEIVGIDVRPLINPVYLQNVNQTELEEVDDSLLTGFGINKLEVEAQTDLAQSFKDLSLSQNPTGEYEYMSEEHRELFVNTVNSVKAKLQRYITQLQDKVVDAPDKDIRIGKLLSLLKELDNTDSLATVESISAYIVQASGWLEAIYKNYYENEKSVRSVQLELDSGIDTRTNELLTPEQRDERIKWVSIELNKAKHYLYLFEDLVKFRDELTSIKALQGIEDTKGGEVDFSAKFISDINDKLDSWEVSPGLRQRVDEFLKSGLFSVPGLQSVLTSVLSQQSPTLSSFAVEDQIQDFIKKLREDHPVQSAEALLTRAVGYSLKLKSKLAEQHYQNVKDWLWPKIAAKQETYDGKFKLNEEDFITLLKSAQEDEDWFTYNLDAPIQSKDAVTAITANIVSDELYKALGITRADVSHLSGVRDLLKLEKSYTAAQIGQYHDAMTHNVIIPYNDPDGNNEADQDWDGPVLVIDVWPGVTFKRKGQYKKAFMTEFNDALYDSHVDYFFKTRTGQIDQYMEQVPRDAAGKALRMPNGNPDVQGLLTYLKANGKTNIYAQAILDELFNIDKKSGLYVLEVPNVDIDNIAWLRSKMNRAVTRTFFAENNGTISEERKVQYYAKYGVMDEYGRLLDKPHINSFIKANSSEARVQQDPEEKRSNLVKFPKSLENLVSYTIGKTTFVYARARDSSGNINYSWVDINKAHSFTGVTHLYYNKYKLARPAQKYHIDNNGFGAETKAKWNSLKADQTKWDYSRELYDMYESANDDNLKYVGLKYGIIPQVEKLANVDFGDDGWWDRLWKWLANHTFAKTIRDAYHWINGTQEDSNQHRYNELYLNNQPIKRIPARFTHYLKDENIEEDLFRSVLMYKAASNQYRAMRNIEPQIQNLKTLIQGDTFLSIEERQAIDERWEQKLKDKIIPRQSVKKAARLNKKLVSFLDDIVYGDAVFAAQYKLMGKELDMTKVGQVLSGMTAFGSLALNVSSMFGNIGVGFLANYSESVKGKYYHPEDWWKGQELYWTAMRKGQFFKDLQETNPDKRSMLTQLATYFDAIQGEILDDQGNISRTGTTERMMNWALYFTQSGAEHLIQTVSMAAQLRGFKLADGRSLLDAVQYTEGQAISFDNVSSDELRQFQQQLHSVNKQLHGHYASFDKSMFQRHWLGQMVMMFKKYIYSSLRYRFGGERFDWEAGDETQGFLNKYWSQLSKEVKESQSIWKRAAILGNGFIVRPTLGAIDQLVGGTISKNSKATASYLYGDDFENRNEAAHQTAFDVLWYTLFALVAATIHGLDDDDDPNGVVMQNIEAFSVRMQGDLGMYLPLVGAYGVKTAFTTYDKSWQLVKSPIAQVRTYDNTVSLISQLFSDAANLEFETYSRSGPGYEKGEFKVTSKLEKSVFGPYYNLGKLFSPSQVLQYQNMAQRNSR